MHGRRRRRFAASVAFAAFAGLGIGVVAQAADDTTPPAGTVVIEDGAAWTNDLNGITLILDATDDLAGVASVEYRSNGGPWTTRPYSPLPFETQLHAPIQGANTVEARWTDHAGNLSAIKADTIKLDSVVPTATVKLYDNPPGWFIVDVTATDANGIAGVWFSCDKGTTWVSKSMASRIKIATGPSGLGCTSYGMAEVWVEPRDPAGNGARTAVPTDIIPTFHMEYPLPAKTGSPFTIKPVFSEGFTPAPADFCRWEFRWGNTASLRDNEFDETFGFLLFEGPASEGFCGAWTFTLPWVPVPQFEIDFRGPATRERPSIWPDRDVFTATAVGTDRRIRSSNLPLAQVLPDDYTPVVGEPVTYTRYLVGGAPSGTATWTAHLGSGEDPVVWERHTTSSTFTITPPTTGRLLVQWYREANGRLMSAGYDPPVRRPDTTRPNTTQPVPKFGSGMLTAKAPVGIFWGGTDTGSGIKSYALERSVNGGAWTKVTLPSATARSVAQSLAFNTDYRYRVRATDRAGNVGWWDYSATFRVKAASDSNSAIRYGSGWRVVADPEAFGGVVHEARVAGSAARYTFTGHSVAWIAERGPGYGKARVYIDGKLHSTVDLGQSTPASRLFVFRKSWPSIGTHSIRIVVEGTSGRPIVDLDGFAVLR